MIEYEIVDNIGSFGCGQSSLCTT